MNTRFLSSRLAAVLLALAGTVAAPAAQRPVRVVLDTALGRIEIEVDTARAPVTAANFLKYVDGGFYDGGQFHRAVTLDNQPNDEVKIEVVQASVNAARARQQFPPIALERTNVTGFRHKDGTVSMARSGPDSATSSFFICIGDQPELDFGGRRNRDGQGFAAFGRVVAGMDVVRRIQHQPVEGQTLTPPIRIVTASRGPSDLTVTVKAGPAFGIIGDVLVKSAPRPDLLELWTRTDAVAHLRVERSLGAAPWALTGDPWQHVVSTEYEATAIEVLKSHAHVGAAGGTVRFLDTYAGVWTDNNGQRWRSFGGLNQGPFRPGQAVIAFLKWNQLVERYCTSWVLTFRDGRVAPGPLPVTDLDAGTPADVLLARLRAMAKRPPA